MLGSNLKTEHAVAETIVGTIMFSHQLIVGGHRNDGVNENDSK